MANDAMQTWRVRYDRAHVPTIPLWSNSKRPAYGEDWPNVPPLEQWQRVGPDFTGNIGILGGRELAIIDCDAPETIANVNLWLADQWHETPGTRDKKKFVPPVVRTAHGNAHFWVHVGPVDTVPPDFTKANLARSVGPGELIGNFNVVAPCSKLGPHRYQFERGGPETLTGVPYIQWQELTWLIAPDTLGPRLEAPPLRLLRRDMPPSTYSTLLALRDAPKRTPIGHYLTRSEAEAGVVAALICAGWSLHEIAAEFEKWQPGHYAAYKARHREGYVLRTYQNVLTFLASTYTRRTIAELWHAAQQAAWPGAGGILEQQVYAGLLAVAWQFERFAVSPGLRALAEYAAASETGTGHALRRLAERGLIERKGTGPNGTWYGVLPGGVSKSRTNHSISMGSAGRQAQTDTAEREPVAWQRLTVAPHLALPHVQELWAPAALGRSAGVVFGVLGETPRTVAELVTLTGKSERTVWRALGRLHGKGLADRADGGWIRGIMPLGLVAAVSDVEKKASWRRGQHERQRVAFELAKSRARAP